MMIDVTAGSAAPPATTRRPRRILRGRLLTPSELAAVFAVLTIAFTIFAAQVIAPFGAESFQRLRDSFSADARADYETQLGQRVAPQRPAGSSTGN